MFIPEDIIENVRVRSDIAEILSEYIVLKKAGRNYKSLCPFHNEKTPSFMVSAEKQIFHCFGCGAGGNVFNFLMKIEGLTFYEVLKKLASRAGIKLPSPSRGKEDSAQYKEKELLFTLHEQAAAYYHKFLLESKAAQEAREYLKKRKINADMISKFRIGYAPRGNNLMHLSQGKGYTLDLLKKSGLVSIYSDSQHPHDYFQDRLIFPICNPQGQVIAFGGRILTDERKPKYLNSPDTALYSKSRSLYAIHIAGGSIRLKQQAIIFEGYIDVISAHKHDISNSIATLGTSLTSDHIHLLKRYAEEVLIIYDADNPGITATLRGLDMLVDSGLRVKVATLPSHQDPDDFLRASGKEAFLNVVEEALALVDYRFNIACTQADISTTGGKVHVVKEVLPSIARIKNAVEQREEVKKLAQRLSLDEESLLIELNKDTKHKKRGVQAEKLAPVKTTSGIEQAQRELVQLMLSDCEVLKRVKVELKPENFTASELFPVVQVIFKLSLSSDESEFISRIIDTLQDEQLSQIVSGLMMQEIRYTDKQRAMDGLIKTIKLHALRQEYERLESEVRSMLDRNQQPPAKILKEYQHLVQVLKGSRRN
ncbi:MAG: DNA primase [bacterium]